MRFGNRVGDRFTRRFFDRLRDDLRLQRSRKAETKPTNRAKEVRKR